MTCATSAPVVSFGFRGTSGEVLEVGEPLAVLVTLRAPAEAVSPIELAPATGNWTQAVAVELAPVASGVGKKLQAAALGKPVAPHATLDHTRIAGGGWLFTSEATGALAPGDYAVSVRVRIADGNGWRGESVAYPRNVRVVAATPNSVRRTLALAGEAMLTDHLETAAGILDEFLKTKPKEPAALVSRGIVAERAGNLMAATWFANKAAETLSAKGPPPLELHELQVRLREKLRRDAIPAAAPPAWSWPPKEMLQARFAEIKKTLPAPAPVAKPATSAMPTTRTPAVNPTTSPVPPSVPAAMIYGVPSSGVLVPSTEISESAILVDQAGQWASTAAAGSQYSQPQYAPAQATGVPDITKAGDSPKAWCHSGASKALDWLEVAFAKPVRATEVRVRQTLNPGTIIKLEAIEPNGTSHVWWEGRDAAGLALPAGTIAWFAVRVPQPDYLVARVKLTLDLGQRVGWKQIDAVQLVEAK